MNSRPAILLLVGALVTTGGCAMLGSGKKKPPPPPPTALEAPLPGNQWVGTRFEAIPIPQGFTLDYDASYLNVSENGPRVADLRYSGRTALTDVLTYVQRGMLDNGWRLTSLTGVAIKTLRYTKEDEECEIVVHKDDSGQSILMIRLHPRP